MMKQWEKQSAEAAAQGVCHTEADCKLMYEDIPREKREAACTFIHALLSDEQKDEIRKAQMNDPEHWMSPFHLGGGMWLRNQLRMSGMGEEYFEVDNLDCIQKSLIDEALWMLDRSRHV